MAFLFTEFGPFKFPSNFFGKGILNYFNPEKQFENEKFEITIMGFISTVFMISFYYYFLFEMVKTIVIYFAIIFILFIGLSFAYNSAVKVNQ